MSELVFKVSKGRSCKGECFETSITVLRSLLLKISASKDHRRTISMVSTTIQPGGKKSVGSISVVGSYYP